MIVRNFNKLALLVGLILPIALGILGYLIGQILNIPKLSLVNNLFDKFREVPIVDQLYLLEVSRRGQESGDRFADIVVCLFFSLIIFLVSATTVAILKDGWRKQQGLSSIEVSFCLFLGSVFSCFMWGAIFFLRMPFGEEGRKGRIIENTDFKFVVYYCVAALCASSAIVIFRYIFQLTRNLFKNR